MMYGVISEEDSDILGEVYNIGMGAAATAMSKLLLRRVDITSPVTEVVACDDVVYRNSESAVGVAVEYSGGITDTNVFILNKQDVVKIVDILLGGIGEADESAEVDDMHISAFSEIMNQMMGSSATALAHFFGAPVSISVPRVFRFENRLKFISEIDGSAGLAVTKFKFKVDGVIDNEMFAASSFIFVRETIAKAKCVIEANRRRPG